LLSRRLGVVLATIVAAVVLSGLCGVVWGGEYPTKNITFIIPYAPGGTVDPVSRILTQVSEPLLKGKFVMVNKPGAAAVLGTAEIIQAKPDGYTIGMTNDGAIGLSPQIMKIPYNGPEDYQPIIKTVWFQSAIVVRADAPWKTLADFTAEARKRPGQLKVGLSGPLNIPQIAMTYYNQLVGIEVNFVPFSAGGGEMMTNLLGGHTDACATNPATAQPHVLAGKARILVVMPGDRTPIFPDVPSMKELGYDFPTPVSQYFVIGPKGMDKAVVDKLYKAFAEALKTPAFQQFATKNGMIIDVAGPEESTRQIKEILKIYTKVIKDFNVEVRK
jgi:tripartite-type tricarboxylate transporter receptor subunit TctC